MTSENSRPCMLLQDLPLKLIAAAYLCSVGVGYISALINLHFQEATPGETLPGPGDVVRIYHGGSANSQIERLLIAPSSLPFNGSGSMRGAFTTKKNAGAIKTGAAEMLGQLRDAGFAVDALKIRSTLEEYAAQWLDFERLGLLEWIKAGHPRNAYDTDTFDLPDNISTAFVKMKTVFAREIEAMPKSPSNKKNVDPVTPETISFCDTVRIEGGKITVRIKTIFDDRCARCHSDGKSVSSYPLSRYEQLKVYLTDDHGLSDGKSLAKLALTTHVHLLGFAVLYGLTGLIFACLPYPSWLRAVLAPAPLILQVIDISFWWLARLEAPWGPFFAHSILVTGGLVALALISQIVLGLWGLFPGKGRYAVIAILAFGGIVGLVTKVLVIDPHLAHEKKAHIEAVFPDVIP